MGYGELRTARHGNPSFVIDLTHFIRSRFMSSNQRRPGSLSRGRGGRFTRVRIAMAALFAACTPATHAAEAEVRILHFEATADGRLRIQHSVPADHYFILLGGTDAARISTPLAFQLSGSGAGTLEAGVSPTGSAFFQVRAVSESAPLDLDGDGLDDRFELLWRPLLNPLDPADAHQDPDNDGRTTFEEYLRGTDPSTANALTTTFTSSPAAGGADVAVMRETIIQFSAPLSQAVTPVTNAVSRHLRREVPALPPRGVQ